MIETIIGATFIATVVVLVLLVKGLADERRGRDLFWEQILLDWREREEQRK